MNINHSITKIYPEVSDLSHYPHELYFPTCNHWEFHAKTCQWMTFYQPKHKCRHHFNHFMDQAAWSHKLCSHLCMWRKLKSTGILSSKWKTETISMIMLLLRKLAGVVLGLSVRSSPYIRMFLGLLKSSGKMSLIRRIIRNSWISWLLWSLSIIRILSNCIKFMTF